jgi:hypothetical protein
MRIILANALASLSQGKTDVDQTLGGVVPFPETTPEPFHRFSIDGAISLVGTLVSLAQGAVRENSMGKSVRGDNEGPRATRVSIRTEGSPDATWKQVRREDDAPDATWKPVRREDDGLHSILDAGR